ncbi:MAG: ABC transporter substrate-binding protein [Alicyclobacillus sp.]|nr:ABC transporter substrate-binding protein [Alicyclobacillus sp.]
MDGVTTARSRKVRAKRTAAWMALAAAGASAIAGVTPAMGKNMQTVRFSEVIRSVFYAPQYVALAEGFFKKQGLNVEVVTSQGSDKGAAALIAGTADISLIGPETSVYIYNQHGTTMLRAFYQLTDTDGSFIMSRTKMSHFKWSDLAGHTVVSWRPGSSPQMVLAHVLTKYHVPNVKVITNIAATAMVGAFESGKGDFIQVYEPTVETLQASGKAYLVASVGAAAGNYPETAYEATDAYIKAHPDVIQAWCNAIYQASQWIHHHSPKEVASAISSYFPGTSTAQLAASIKRYESLHAWQSPFMTKQQYNILQSVLIEAKTEPANQKVPYNQVFISTFAKKAMSSQ